MSAYGHAAEGANDDSNRTTPLADATVIVVHGQYYDSASGVSNGRGHYSVMTLTSEADRRYGLVIVERPGYKTSFQRLETKQGGAVVNVVLSPTPRGDQLRREESR